LACQCAGLMYDIHSTRAFIVYAPLAVLYIRNYQSHLAFFLSRSLSFEFSRSPFLPFLPLVPQPHYSVAGNSCPTRLNRSKILKKKTIRKIINKFCIISQTLLDRYILSIYYSARSTKAATLGQLVVQSKSNFVTCR
jgi:hypothetical protein